MKLCNNKDDVPTDKHFAIVIFSTYHVEGDERSRTNPGHGYPAHTEHKAEYRAFTSKQEWEQEVAKLANQKGYSSANFVALVVQPATITTEVKVNVDG